MFIRINLPLIDSLQRPSASMKPLPLDRNGTKDNHVQFGRPELFHRSLSHGCLFRSYTIDFLKHGAANLSFAKTCEKVKNYIGGAYRIEPCPRICNPLHNHSANANDEGREYYNPETYGQEPITRIKKPATERAFSVST